MITNIYFIAIIPSIEFNCSHERKEGRKEGLLLQALIRCSHVSLSSTRSSLHISQTIDAHISCKHHPLTCELAAGETRGRGGTLRVLKIDS